jgi:uncharacterized protein (TIGR02145 family)
LKTIIDSDGTNYYLPTKTPLKNIFIKGDILKDIDLASSAVLNNQTKIYPEVDAFYATNTLTLDKGTTSIDFTLLRMGFGINFTVDAITSGAMEIYVGNDTLKLNSTKTSAFTVRQFSTALNSFGNIYSNATTFGDSIAISAKWISGSGTTVTATGKYKFLRNYQKTINIQLNTLTNNFNFEGWNIVYDIDGNAYHTVTIGTQTWMAENLKVTHYRDGSIIPNVTNNSTWISLTTGAYCDYNNLPSNSDVYGKFYNWYAVIAGKNIAPIGYHIPTDSEWIILENYLLTHLGYSSNIAKSLATNTLWNTYSISGTVGCNLIGNNSSGFSSLPSGSRYDGGIFVNLGYTCNWWCISESDSSNGWYRYLSYNQSALGRATYTKVGGLSIRCIKD